MENSGQSFAVWKFTRCAPVCDALGVASTSVPNAILSGIEDLKFATDPLWKMIR